MADFVTDVRKWIEELATWVQENLGDPYIVGALRDDLGLAPGESVPEAQRERIKQFAAGLDPDKQGFTETVDDIRQLVEALVQLGEQLADDDSSVSPWDVVYLLAKLLASELIRTREPIVYAVGKAAMFVSDDPEQLSEFDPVRLVQQARGDAPAPGSGEQLAQRVSALCSLAAVTLEQILDRFVGPKLLDAYYGWDGAPDSPTPNADLVSGRAMTFVISLPKVGEALTTKIALTVLGVPREHSGPGIFITLGGEGEIEAPIDRTTLKLAVGVTNAVDMFIGWDDSARGFEISGDPDGHLRFSIDHAGGDDEPAIRIGDADATRLDIGKIGLGVDLDGSSAALRVFMKEAELVIKAGGADGFLRNVLSSEIKLGFDIGLIADTRGGLRVEGGTRARATIPVEKSLTGVLDVHTIELALGPGGEGRDLGLELSTGLGLNLGPFRASVDRLGFKLEVAFREGNLGILDAALGFKPPSGLGMQLDAGIVKGGGYLYFDFDRQEYAGALELKIASFSLKAIGMLTTRMPDGSEGFSLLLLLYAELPRFHIAFGIFFEGVGGLIGLHHGADVNALQTQMPQGAFDDVLFPNNPVADAPRIINRLRVLFPIRRDAFLIGPMFMLSWGAQKLGEVKLGLVFAIDNALGGDRPASLGKILMLGQVKIGMPETTRGEAVRIIVDFLGYLDFDAKRFGFYARLRDSKLVGVLELTGSLLLVIDYGEQPAFVLAVGGFHPRFRDLPSGLPAKLDRIGIKFKIGSVVEVSVTCYFAVTSATIQFGAEVRVKVDLGAIKIEGYLGFDALIYYQPRFSFEIDFRAGMAIKVFGETLLGVDVEGTLSGPGRWRMKGKAKFKILFWEFSPEFDEQWGDEPVVERVETNVSALLAAEYAKADNWTALLPAGSESYVTLSALLGETDLLAHPLGELRVSQRAVPLGLKLEKFGETIVAGPNQFELTEARVGGRIMSERKPTRDHFARGSYQNLSEEQKLTEPSFENFDTGVVFSTDDYTVPEATSGDLSYETKILEPGKRGEREGVLRIADLLRKDLSYDVLLVAAQAGAAAQCSLRKSAKLAPVQTAKLQLVEPALVAVDALTLSAANQVKLEGQAQNNRALAEQAVSGARVEHGLLIEAYELAS